jgi:hypothetical protein
MVDDAVERKPESPITEVVELPHVCEVNGKTWAASVAVAIVFTCPAEPMYPKPCVSDER